MNQQTFVTSTIRTLIFVFACLYAGASHAQGYPGKPVRVIVPYPAGGVVDIVARVVTEKVAASWGQPIIVEDRPGANASIGAELVAKAPADGYTLLMASPFLVVNPFLYSKLSWKPQDFTAVALVGAPPNVWVVPANSPVHSLKEMVDYAKARPGQLNAHNPGNGSSNHLGQEVFFGATGIDLVNINYKGQPPAIPDIVSGQIHFTLLTQMLAVSQIKTGKIRALAISAPARAPDLPDVPTVAEAGYGDTMVLPWYGFVAPAGTPRNIVLQINAEVGKALKSPDVIERLAKIGAQILTGTPEEFETLIRNETARWAKVVKERNIKAD